MKKNLLFLTLVLPLGALIGCGGSKNTQIAVCNDTANAIRAFELLYSKNYISTLPVNEDHTELTFTSNSWTDSEKQVTVTLVSENLLVQSMPDYHYVCLPCNTAMTGNVTATPVDKEDDPEQVSSKANGLVCRKTDYENNANYRGKIDVLTDILLSEEVSNYVTTTYNGKITCDSTSQIDLRDSHETVEGTDKNITVCASDIPHADILNSNVVKDALSDKGYSLTVTVLDWSIQNAAVADGDYDCNYFQHEPYLQTQNSEGKLYMTCKVHYEPLGIYKGGK